MFCLQCGNEIKDGAKFCGKCGWAVPVTVVQEAAQVVPVEKRCASCGTALKDGAKFCPKCGGAVQAGVPTYGNAGTQYQGVKQEKQSVSSKNYSTLLILSILLGLFGVDRFYVGKIGTGILKFITCGGCYVWWIIDIISVVKGKFTDKNGNTIKKIGG